jgi:hypothetical protein
LNIDPEPAKSEAIKATENARASINSTRPRATLPRSGFVQQHRCRQRLEGSLSRQKRLALAVA